MESLTKYYKNINTQRGEDGILKEILRIMNIENGYFVEFGADDGITLSNTRELALKGWSGCFIETQLNRFNKLIKNYKNNEKITTLYKTITINGKNSFDNIMKNHFNNSLDVVSIDIDGKDYEVFKSIGKFLPKIVIIECNPYRDPLDETYYGDDIPNIQESLFVFNELAEKKGYKLICYTQNIFFIKKEYFHLFDVSENLMDHFKDGLKILINYEDNEVFNRIFNRLTRLGQKNGWLKKIHKEIIND